jgi:hypothetical protein
LILACAAAAVVSAVAAAAVPNFFVAGQPASAAAVNANFAYLDERAIGTIIFRIFGASSDTSTSVVTVTCPANTYPAAANCACSNAEGTRNIGVLFACSTTGNGAVAACLPEPVTYNQFLPLPRADVGVQCITGRTVDGRLITWTPIPAKQQADELAAKQELRAVEAQHAAALAARQ